MIKSRTSGSGGTRTHKDWLPSRFQDGVSRPCDSTSKKGLLTPQTVEEVLETHVRIELTHGCFAGSLQPQLEYMDQSKAVDYPRAWDFY